MHKRVLFNVEGIRFTLEQWLAWNDAGEISSEPVEVVFKAARRVDR